MNNDFPKIKNISDAENSLLKAITERKEGDRIISKEGRFSLIKAADIGIWDRITGRARLESVLKQAEVIIRDNEEEIKMNLSKPQLDLLDRSVKEMKENYKSKHSDFYIKLFGANVAAKAESIEGQISAAKARRGNYEVVLERNKIENLINGYEDKLNVRIKYMQYKSMCPQQIGSFVTPRERDSNIEKLKNALRQRLEEVQPRDAKTLESAYNAFLKENLLSDEQALKAELIRNLRNRFDTLKGPDRNDPNYLKYNLLCDKIESDLVDALKDPNLTVEQIYKKYEFSLFRYLKDDVKKLDPQGPIKF